MSDALNNNKGNKHSAADIDRYLAGNLTPAEMHALEKAALDDPFLAEAIEGYAAVPQQDREQQLAALRTQVSETGVRAKVIPLRRKNNWWKSVAAILIIGSGLAVTYLVTSNDSPAGKQEETAQTLSAVEPATATTDTNADQSITQSLNPTATNPGEIIATNSLPVQKNGNSEIKEQIIPDPAAPVFKPDPQADLATSVTTLPATTTTEPARSTQPPTVPQVMENYEAAKVVELESVAKRKQNQSVVTSAKKEAALNNFFTAQVVGTDNSPLPFTNITVKKENFGTYADSKGMLRLVSTDSILNVELRSVGYKPKTIILRSGSGQTKIALEELNLATTEENPGANKSARDFIAIRRPALQANAATNVEPADGWDNYNTYVANNIQIPQETLKKEFKGAVELSFEVKADGTISNIRISKSMGEVYDEAAKKLILEGPKWKIKKGRKTSASVSLQF